MRGEHEMTLVSRARGPHHRRHDSDDDGQTRKGPSKNNFHSLSGCGMMSSWHSQEKKR